MDEPLSDDETALLYGFGPDERIRFLRYLRESDAPQEVARRWKPTRDELIAAKWLPPPLPPPTEEQLLHCLRNTREEGQRVWAMFSHAGDEVLLRMQQSGNHPLIRHKVTKRWGDMWRLADADNPRFYKGET